ncbi:MAG: CbtB-domain containing protein [Alphaproteobacteria bacterium]|jgi:cobalt transporter subunit CbtB|nr:CbtB-domain containing protein [Alphaproteobacteria bacterium]
MTTATTTVKTAPKALSDRIAAIAAALIVGLGLVYLTGFSHSQSLHDAAHDTRHGLAFPCH